MFSLPLSPCQNQKRSQPPPFQIDNLNHFSGSQMQNILGFLEFEEQAKVNLVNKNLNNLSKISLISIHYCNAEKIIEIVEKHLPISFHPQIERSKTEVQALKKRQTDSQFFLNQLTTDFLYLGNHLIDCLACLSEEKFSLLKPELTKSLPFFNKNLLEASASFAYVKREISVFNQQEHGPQKIRLQRQLLTLIRNTCKNLNQLGYPKQSLKLCSLAQSFSTQATILGQFIEFNHQEWNFKDILNLAIEKAQSIEYEGEKAKALFSIICSMNEKEIKKILQTIDLIPEKQRAFANKTFHFLMTKYLKQDLIPEAMLLADHSFLKLKFNQYETFHQNIINYCLKNQQFEAAFSITLNCKHSPLRTKFLQQIENFFYTHHHYFFIKKEMIINLCKTIDLSNFSHLLNFIQKIPHDSYKNACLFYICLECIKRPAFEELIQTILLLPPPILLQNSFITHLSCVFLDEMKKQKLIDLNNPISLNFIAIFLIKLIHHYQKGVNFNSLLLEVNHQLNIKLPEIYKEELIQFFMQKSKDETSSRKRNREDFTDLIGEPSLKIQKKIH